MTPALAEITRPALPPGYSPSEARAALAREHRLLVEVYPWDHPRAVRLRAAMESSDPFAVAEALPRGDRPRL